MRIGTVSGAILAAACFVSPIAAQSTADAALKAMAEGWYARQLAERQQIVAADGSIQAGSRYPSITPEAEQRRAADAQAALANLRKIDKAALSDAGRIDAAVFDLKAVNPNAVAVVDERTPGEIIESITTQGRIVADALARLNQLMAAPEAQA